MIISIHQPQYYPWLPYFEKILKSDLFIFLDNVQFQKNGIINRNELKNSKGKFWLTVPIINPKKNKILDVKIDNQSNWIKKHISSIETNYSRSDNYIFFKDNILPIYSRKYDKIADLNIEIIEVIIKKYFQSEVKFLRQKNIITQNSGSDLILELCKKNNATKYISGQGGKNYLDLIKFKDNNIDVEFINNHLPFEYAQQYNKTPYIADISALDFVLNIKDGYKKYINL